MTDSDHDGNMNVGGYPSANGDRNLRDFNPSTACFTDAYNILKDIVSPVDVALTAVLNNGVVDVTAKATFKTNISNGTYNLSVVAVEDWISSTASGYAQSTFRDKSRAWLQWLWPAACRLDSGRKHWSYEGGEAF